jgi:hypothetical protein
MIRRKSNSSEVTGDQFYVPHKHVALVTDLAQQCIIKQYDIHCDVICNVCSE